MSNQPNNTSEYRQETLARFEQARAAHKFGEATIWANTSACLDSAEDRVDPVSPVNKALFQLVFDVARDCETLVLRCGNVTTTHGDLLGHGSEAIATLQARLTDASPGAVRPMVIVIGAHLEDLCERLGMFFNKTTVHAPSSVKQACLLRDTVRTIQQLIISVPGLDVDIAATFAARAELLFACAGSPDYLVYHFPFGFLTEWDRALFFVEGAQFVVADMQARAGFLSAEQTAPVSRISDLLAEARRLLEARDKGVKRLYPMLSDLALALALSSGTRPR